MNKATRKLTEGAMMVAITGLLLFVNRQFGNVLEYLMYWILTFPILVYTAQYGIKDALIPSMSMMLLSVMIAMPTTIFYLFICIVVGLVYGEGVRRQWRNGWLLIWSGIFTFCSYLITTVLFGALFGYHPAEDIELATSLIRILHLDTQINSRNVVGILVIFVAIIMSILQTICIHMLSNLLLHRLKMNVHRMQNIIALQVPKWVGWIIVIISVLFWGKNVLKLNQEVTSILLSIYMMAKMFACGYGVLALMSILFMMGRRKLFFFVFLGVFINYVQEAIALFGVVDIVFQIRKKMKRGVINGSFREF